MYISSITLHNVRCFETFSLQLESPIVLIQGNNGSGKSSLVEALYYACYLRPLRTHIPREIIRHGQQHFFIGLTGTTHSEWHLSVGFSENKRQAKIDEVPVKNYKELIDTYCLISAIDDDMLLIKGSPECRRSFMDQALLIMDPSLTSSLRQYRRVCEQRNALLAQGGFDAKTYDAWTEQAWQAGTAIVNARKLLLQQLQENIQQLAYEFNVLPPGNTVGLLYQSKLSLGNSYKEFLEENLHLKMVETASKRAIFGPHLDDMAIVWIERQAKAYASRGQQKLVVFLLKIALYRLINKPAIVALDDFTADLDEKRIELMVTILQSLKTQVILTCPLQSSLLGDLLQGKGQLVTLS